MTPTETILARAEAFVLEALKYRWLETDLLGGQGVLSANLVGNSLRGLRLKMMGRTTFNSMMSGVKRAVEPYCTLNYEIPLNPHTLSLLLLY